MKNCEFSSEKKYWKKRNCSKNSGNIGKTLVRIIYDDLIRFYIFIH